MSVTVPTTMASTGPAQVMIGNLYYDALKTLWGCTAFVVDDDNGPLHARNLDWWTENGALSTSTLTTRFVGGDRSEFVTVGWPGFVGALSGMATGRFSVSLNAVASEDGVEVAVPVVSLVRQVLERAVDFDDAVAVLSSTTIASDCLLTVAGTKRGEGVVIERTPRHAVRRMEHGIVVATNDYRALSVNAAAAPETSLSSTSCDRFDRAVQRLGTAPSTLDACLSILGDTRIQMGITVQQMAFRAKTGEHRVRLPTTTEPG